MLRRLERPERRGGNRRKSSRTWNVLTRAPDVAVPGSSLLPLPYPYVVPGGRFREVYYWDSYFTMLGLCVSGREDLSESMVQNFAFLLRTYGLIPNGNRTYYLSRSQPPFFALMVELLARKLVATGEQWDAPNGWAPLQWMAVQGLERYGQHALAVEVARRWIGLNRGVYARTGKLMEKYDVENLALPGGGGEYPTQDGFGWTNGVLLALLREYPTPAPTE